MSLALRVLGLAFVWLASFTLGSEEFGVLALALSCYGLVAKLAGLGLPTVTQRFLSGDGVSDSRQVFGAIFGLSVASGIAGGALLYGFAPVLADRVFSEPALVGPLRVLAVGVVAMSPYNTVTARLQSQELVREYSVVEIVRAGAKLSFLGLGLAWVHSAVGAALSIPASVLAASILAVRYIRREHLLPAGRDITKHLGTVARYAAPLMIVGFSYFLASQADRLMLGWLRSSTEVGVYTVASSVSHATGLVHGALVMAFMPLASEAYRAGESRRLCGVFRTVGKWAGTFNGIVLLVFVTAGPFFLSLFGAEYAAAGTYEVLLLLTALMFVGSWVGPTGAVLQMTDGQTIELLNTVVFVISNIVLNLLLIPIYGILGAALATFCSGLIRNGLQVWEIRSRLGFLPLGRASFLLLLPTTLGCIAGLVTYNQVALRWLSIGIGIVGILGVFIYALQKAEKELIGQVLKHMAG